jgi:hypothetical protein
MSIVTHPHRIAAVRATVVAGAAIATLAVVAGPSSAGDRPSASVSPTTAVAGSLARVSGVCDASDTTGVSLALFIDAGHEGRPTGVTASGPVSGGAASFSIRLPLPASLAAGRYRVEVSCHRPTNGFQLLVPLQIVARAHATPAVPVTTPARALPAQPVRARSRFTG